MLNLVHLISATLPAIVPLATFLLIRSVDHSITLSRDNWDQVMMESIIYEEYIIFAIKSLLSHNFLFHHKTGPTHI
jgi:hypothetical protein